MDNHIYRITRVRKPENIPYSYYPKSRRQVLYGDKRRTSALLRAMMDGRDIWDFTIERSEFQPQWEDITEELTNGQ